MSLLSTTLARPAASAADPLGLDMKVGADLDPSGRSATGSRAGRNGRGDTACSPYSLAPTLASPTGART